MFDATSNKDREKFEEKIKKYEKISDSIEVESCNISAQKSLKIVTSHLRVPRGTRSMYKID
ncbi:MAG: hypothetical protein MZV63_14505 [Marinilabiliales bacterium]|nr:hypothetical protein [Marinilabiliales bacterium]